MTVALMAAFQVSGGQTDLLCTFFMKVAQRQLSSTKRPCSPEIDSLHSVFHESCTKGSFPSTRGKNSLPEADVTPFIAK
jgi:hypothetical protein